MYLTTPLSQAIDWPGPKGTPPSEVTVGNNNINAACTPCISHAKQKVKYCMYNMYLQFCSVGHLFPHISVKHPHSLLNLCWNLQVQHLASLGQPKVQFFTCIARLVYISHNLVSCLNAFNNWMVQNSLRHNQDKTEAILISTPDILKKLQHLQLSIPGYFTSTTSNIKTLGGILQYDLQGCQLLKFISRRSSRSDTFSVKGEGPWHCALIEVHESTASAPCEVSCPPPH